jgi:DNA-binding MarR family transcriptional regulator
MADPLEDEGWEPPGTEQRLALQRLRRALHNLTSAERLLQGRYQRRSEPFSLAHRRALFALRVGPMAAGQLAREAQLNPTTMTTMIDELEAHGLVQRQRDAHDRRVWWISLTEEGRAEVSETETRWNNSLSEAFADTSDQDLEVAIGVLERLTTLWQRQSQTP